MDKYPSHDEISHQYSALTNVLGGLNDYYRFMLTHAATSDALNYLMVDRKLSEETIDHFALGLAPAASKVQEFLVLNQLSADDVRTAGVLIDKFEDRITFPLFDMEGKVVGFSGRTWRAGDARAKYYNSLSSPTFWKSLALYGFYQAKDSIRRDNFALVVEGNIDVIQLHVGGLSHAVAPCGTSLTKAQLIMLTRLTDRVLFCFDADPAGVRAALKAKTLCEKLNFEFVSFEIPDAKDPDEFIRTRGIQPIIDIVMGVLREYKGRKKDAS